MKTITIFSKHFWPENFKINDLCFQLRKKFKVDVYTSFPNYNNIKYKRKLKDKVKHKGINIKYFKSYLRSGNNFFNIFFDYFIYVLTLLFKINFYIKTKSNICITFATSPIFQALPAIYYSKIKKIPNIIWVQDLWPEVLEDTGYIKNKYALRFVDKFVKFIYAKSDLIIAQSNSFKNHIKKKYKITNKIVTLHQPSEFKFQKKSSNKKNLFYVTYAGNFGSAQDFDTIINAFSSHNLHKNIRLNLIGTGKKMQYIKSQIKKKKLDTKILLTGYKSKKKLTQLLKNSSCFFISLRNGKSLNKTIPGKFQTYISFGKPLIICSFSDLNKFIIKNKLGYACKPNQTEKLIKNLNKVHLLNETKINKIYSSSKKVYENFFEINKVTRQMEEYINLAEQNYAKKNILQITK